jgi:glycosyltransferase involved in cell wall biosynthesis
MKQKLRVLLVSPVGEHGGAEQVFLSLAKYLPQWDVEPVLACMRPGPLMELAQKQGLPAYAFREHRFRQVGQIAQGILWLARVIRDAKIDLLHSNHAAHLYSGPAGKWTRVPEMWHIHDYPYRRDGVDRLLERLPNGYVLFTTERVKSGYPQLQSRPHSIVHPICVEPERLRAFPPCGDVRARLGLPTGPLFLTIARLQEHKGHRYLLQAVPRILQHCPEAVFAIVGRAKGAEQEAYQGELQAFCEQQQVMSQVKFLGYVSEPDMIALYREATALVHPATSEGFGLTLLEAMALGTPVLAADADGPREILQSTQAGVLFTRGDSDALADAVREFLEDKGLRATVRRNAESYIAGARVENMAQQTAEVYRRLHKTRG